MTYTQEQMDAHYLRLDELRVQLRRCVKSYFQVYESREGVKRSKMVIVFADESRETFFADDEPNAVERQFEDILRQARRIYGQTVGVEQ